MVASGILTPDEEGFNAVDDTHDPVRGAHRVLAFAQDMLRVSRLVGGVGDSVCPGLALCMSQIGGWWVGVGGRR